MLSDTVVNITEQETVVIVSIEPAYVTETETVVVQDLQNETVVVESFIDSVIVTNDGFKGDKGDTGYGVPSGGTTSQRLVKKSNTDFDTKWESQPPAPPAGADKQLQFNDAGGQGVDQNIRWNKNTKTLEIGVAPDEVFPHNPIAAVGYIDDYYQLIVHNEFEGVSASSDFVATADNGDDDNFYVDLGINSSIYNQPDYNAFKFNDSYLIANGGNLVLNTETAGKNIHLVVGGTLEENLVAEFTATGLTLPDQYTITNRPEIFYGTGDPPSATGLNDGTLFIKYNS